MTTTVRHLRPIHTTDPVIHSYVTRALATAMGNASNLNDLHARIRAQASASEKVARTFTNPRRARSINTPVRRHELVCAQRMTTVATELRRIAAALLTDHAHTW
jgi:hypothetical protein